MTGVNATSGIMTLAVSGLSINYVYGAIANAIQTVHTTRFPSPRM